MLKEAVFTMKLEPELRADFIAEAEAADRPASQIMRELMRHYVRRQREARQYDDFLREKVDAARTSVQAGTGRSNEEVESAFATRRAQAVKKAGGSSGRPMQSMTGWTYGIRSAVTPSARSARDVGVTRDYSSSGSMIDTTFRMISLMSASSRRSRYFAPRSLRSNVRT